MTETLRICLIASSRFPVAEPFMGGLEAHTHALATALMARGHAVSVFAGPGSDPGLGVVELPVASFVSSDAARADLASRPDAWMQEHHAYLDLMMSLGRQRYGAFDVVHNNSLHHLPVALAALLDVPVLTTLHTPPLAWLESAAALAPDSARFVAVSHHVASSWQHVVPAQVVHNGIDTRLWRASRGGTGVIWSGRLVPEKAPHQAVDAARLAGLPIALAGPRHDGRYFEEEIAPRLGRDVVYLGHLRGADLRAAVGSAAVAAVTPLWDEPFGLVAAEALACGTPVAAYDSGALGEILDPATGRLAPTGDVPALAVALREAAALDRRDARARACREFGLERMVDDYERVYRQPRDRSAA